MIPCFSSKNVFFEKMVMKAKKFCDANQRLFVITGFSFVEI